LPSSRTFSSEEFCSVNVPLGVTSLNWFRFVSLTLRNLLSRELILSQRAVGAVEWGRAHNL
jgi:hypothetical protein